MMLEKLKFEWLSFLSAMGLMSRIPIGIFLSRSELTAEHHNQSQIWYPWTGAVLGFFLLVSVAIMPSDWSPFLSAVVLVVIWVAFTGALHLDGLADSADAWVGGIGSPDRTLAIMKDPTSGPMAVVAVLLVLLLKVALIAQILDSLYSLSLILLVLIPLLARAWLLPFLYKTAYVRESARKKIFDAQNVQTSELNSQQGGMATDIASRFPRTAALISFSSSQVVLLLALLFLSGSLWFWLVFNLTALAASLLIRSACIKRIGGYTGDVLGAFIELQETLLLMVLALWLSIL